MWALHSQSPDLRGPQSRYGPRGRSSPLSRGVASQPKVVAAPFSRALLHHLSSQVVGAVVRKHPISTLGIPLVVLAILIALGIYGVIAGSNSLANSNKSTAYSLALDTSQAFSLYVEKVSAWGTWEAHGGAWGRMGGAWRYLWVHGGASGAPRQLP